MRNDSDKMGPYRRNRSNIKNSISSNNCDAERRLHVVGLLHLLASHEPKTEKNLRDAK